MAESSADAVDLGPVCPGCNEPWLRPATNPGRYRCVWCLRRWELTSVCPGCGSHATIARMSSGAPMICNQCGTSMLKEV